MEGIIAHFSVEFEKCQSRHCCSGRKAGAPRSVTPGIESGLSFVIIPGSLSPVTVSVRHKRTVSRTLNYFE